MGGYVAGGFDRGLKPPWSGLDHVAAVVAVGLRGAQLGAPASCLLPVAFPHVTAVLSRDRLAGSRGHGPAPAGTGGKDTKREPVEEHEDRNAGQGHGHRA